MADLKKTMTLVSELNHSHGVTQRGGKKYTQVVHRMEAFRQMHGTDFGVDTSILVDDGQRVVVKAKILNMDGAVIGAGMAEEIRGQGNVNKTSALENAETSAIGRALASLGLHGGSYASANEIAAVQRKEKAIEQRKKPNISVHPLDPEPEPEPEPEPGLLNLRTHLGKTLAELDQSEFSMRLVKMFAVYTNTDKDKEGNSVEPRKRMTFLRELKEHNAEGIEALSEPLREQIDKAYLKNLRSLGAQNGEQ